MTTVSKLEKALLPHLDAAYNLARWLMRDEQEAKDVVQESFIRAFRFFETRRDSGDAKAWLLKIVRNNCYTSLQRNRRRQEALEYDDDLHGDAAAADDPESLLLQKADQDRVRSALERLPVPFREVLVLCELEGLPYKEVAEVLAIPTGTVMSRLSRARGKLKELLEGQGAEDSK
jgi:RNA polymerase sigma-70 factor, ECF subfamily